MHKLRIVAIFFVISVMSCSQYNVYIEKENIKILTECIKRFPENSLTITGNKLSGNKIQVVNNAAIRSYSMSNISSTGGYPIFMQHGNKYYFVQRRELIGKNWISDEYIWKDNSVSKTEVMIPEEIAKLNENEFVGTYLVLDNEEKSIYGYRPKHEFQLFADDKTNAKYYEEKAAVMALAEIKFSFVVGIDCYAGELSFKKVNKNER